MLQYLNQRRGQSTLEYAVLIVIIIGALLSIQVYIKRGVQGRLKTAADDIGDQYSDGNTNVLKKVQRHVKTFQIFKNGSISNIDNTTVPGGESTNTTENSIILNTASEFWGNS